ncbi:MAG: copper resistance protein CopC [Pseudorhodobacter sp.]
MTLLRLLMASLMALFIPTQTLAHAQLRGASPPAQAVVGVAPAEVVLTFNEAVAPLSALWSGPDGTTVEVMARAEDARLIVSVPDEALRGTHVLSWRVVSGDGHPVSGAHVFSIGEESQAMAAAASQAAGRLAAAGRAALTLALAFGVGGLAMAALFAAPVPGVVRGMAFVVLPAVTVLLAGQAADLAGSIGALAQPAAWAALWASPFVGAVVLVLAALLMAMAGGRWLGLAALVTGGLSFAVVGHAGTATPWTAPVVALHGGLAMVWAGSLALLATPAGRLAVLVPFGRVAPVMVSGLAAGGAALAWVQLDASLRGWDVLRDTGYGQVLLAKLALVAAILALAALNRWHLAPAAVAGREDGFRRSLRIELVLMVAVLALTGAFRLTPPPRAMAEPAELAHVHGRLSGGDLRLIPGRRGVNRVEILPHDPDFGPLDPREMGFAFSHPVSGTGPIEAAARRGADGIWVAEVILPMAGDWDIVLRILIDDFTQERLGARITLAD